MSSKHRNETADLLQFLSLNLRPDYQLLAWRMDETMEQLARAVRDAPDEATSLLAAMRRLATTMAELPPESVCDNIYHEGERP